MLDAACNRLHAVIRQVREAGAGRRRQPKAAAASAVLRDLRDRGRHRGVPELAPLRRATSLYAAATRWSSTCATSTPLGSTG